MAAETINLRGCDQGCWVTPAEPTLWEVFQPEVGDIVEFDASLVTGHIGTQAIGALLVLKVDKAEEGSPVIQGRVIGCDDEGVSKTLSNLVNRRHRGVHLCWRTPCTHGDSEEMVHTLRVRWWYRSVFEATYMKPWGKLVLKEYASEVGEVEEEETREPPAGGGRKSALKRPATRAARPREGRRKKRDTRADSDSEGGPKRGSEPGGLAEKLKKLKEKVIGGRAAGRHAPIEVLDSSDEEETEEEESLGEEKEPDGGGPRRPQTSLAIMDMKREPAEPVNPVKKKRKKKKPREVRDPGLQLLAQAEHAREARLQEKKQKNAKKRKSSGLGKVKALVDALRGDRVSEKKRGKEKARRRGDPS